MLFTVHAFKMPSIFISLQAKGKIVVFNQDFEGYGKSVRYRVSGASEAAKVGAVASLIRSVTPFSLYTPHAGEQDYQVNVTKIPTASITIEDAELLQRFQKRGMFMFSLRNNWQLEGFQSISFLFCLIRLENCYQASNGSSELAALQISERRWRDYWEGEARRGCGCLRTH